MSLRREPTYLSTETWRALWLIAKAKECTADEVADRYLAEIISQKHPELIQHRTQVNKLEREIIAKLGRPKNAEREESR